ERLPIVKDNGLPQPFKSLREVLVKVGVFQGINSYLGGQAQWERGRLAKEIVHLSVVDRPYNPFGQVFRQIPRKEAVPHGGDGIDHSIPNVQAERGVQDPEVAQHPILDAVRFVSASPCLSIKAPTSVVRVL